MARRVCATMGMAEGNSSIDCSIPFASIEVFVMCFRFDIDTDVSPKERARGTAHKPPIASLEYVNSSLQFFERVAMFQNVAFPY